MPNKARASDDLMALTVLALLSEAPHHPYEIQRLIRERHKEFAMGKTRALYHSFERLTADGLVEPVETGREGKRPERTVYRITDEGREETVSWLRELLERLVPEFPVFSIGLSFLACLTQGEVIRALQARTIGLEVCIASLDAALRGLQEELHLPRLVLIEAEFNRSQKFAELEWVRGMIRELRSGALAWNPESITKLFAKHNEGS